MKAFTFQITDAAYWLLLKINEAGAVEYRDPGYETLEDFKRTVAYKQGLLTEDWFLARNFGGTYKLVNELVDHGLVDIKPGSWDSTWVLTDLGKQVIKQHERETVEDDVEKWLDETTKDLVDVTIKETAKMCLRAGYNKAKETLYTLKEMRMSYEAGQDYQGRFENNLPKGKSFGDFISSLKQPK